MIILAVGSLYGAAQPATSTRPAASTQPVDQRPGRKPGPTRVLMNGDSLTAEYSGEAVKRLKARGFDARTFAFGGVGMFHKTWVPDTKKQLRAIDPDITVFEYCGNELENVPDQLKRWDDTCRELTAIATERGGKAYWLLSPPFRDPKHDARALALDEQYRRIAKDFARVEIIDGRSALGGEWKEFADNGKRLRHTDGVHFDGIGQKVWAETVNAAVEP